MSAKFLLFSEVKNGQVFTSFYPHTLMFHFMKVADFYIAKDNPEGRVFGSVNVEFNSIRLDNGDPVLFIGSEIVSVPDHYSIPDFQKKTESESVFDDCDGECDDGILMRVLDADK
jgi:hypothetical protein